MVRDSRSPRRSYHSDLPDSNARGSKSSRRDYDRDERAPRYDDRRRDEESSRRYGGDSRDRRRDDRDREEPRWGRRDEGDRRDRDRDRRDRDERDMRDRETDRDRARDRGGDRDRRRDNREGSSRRSASPRRPSRAPSAGGSRSKSPEDKAKPNFGASGLLAAATKTVKHADGTGTVLKYHEPPEARKPSVGWRLYVFKGQEQVDLLHIHRQSAYLIGRDRLVADITIEHPSCSKQHAVVQFRQVHEKNEFGEAKQTVKPFIIDLESTNGTHVNGEQIPTSRFFELKLSDVIKFGESQREYVLLSEDAA